MKQKIFTLALFACSLTAASYAHPAAAHATSSTPSKPVSDTFNWGTGPNASARPEWENHSDAAASSFDSNSGTRSDFNWGTGPNGY